MVDVEMDEKTSEVALSSSAGVVRVNCDICGSDGKPLTQYPQAHICQSCGLIFVPERRNSAEIAADWSKVYGKHYDPTWPGVKARLFYVAEWLDRTIGLNGKSILDIGAGNGFFMDQCRQRGASVAGLEPYGENVAKIRAQDMFCFEGAVGDQNLGQYDLVTMNWTLENCGDALEMLDFAKRHAPIVSVATGSRILVPFKKRLSVYLPGKFPPADLHCWRWSLKSLVRMMEKAGFAMFGNNHYIDNDTMIVRAWGAGYTSRTGAPHDDPDEVQDFFDAWERHWS